MFKIETALPESTYNPLKSYLYDSKFTVTSTDPKR